MGLSTGRPVVIALDLCSRRCRLLTLTATGSSGCPRPTWPPWRINLGLQSSVPLTPSMAPLRGGDGHMNDGHRSRLLVADPTSHDAGTIRLSRAVGAAGRLVVTAISVLRHDESS